LTTVPLTFVGKQLEVNYRTKDGGELRVEILDAAGRRLAPASAPLRGDDLRQPVVFSDRGLLASLAGKPISLKFHLKHAELFSFAFSDE